jgi:hypothetical protein
MGALKWAIFYPFPFSILYFSFWKQYCVHGKDSPFTLFHSPYVTKPNVVLKSNTSLPILSSGPHWDTLIPSLGPHHKLPCSLCIRVYSRNSLSLHISILKLKTAHSSQNLVSAYKSTRCHNLDDWNLSNHNHKILKPYTIYFTFTWLNNIFLPLFWNEAYRVIFHHFFVLEREVRPVMHHLLHYWVEKLPNFGKLAISTPILGPNLPEPLQ